MIRFHDVSKSYRRGAAPAVAQLDLRVAAGELMVLVGQSGCGKTTTLKMINRLIEPTSGRIEVDGRDVAAGDPVQLRRKIGYVFQSVGLFPHMTVAENVAVVPRLLRWQSAEIRHRVEELLALVRLPPAQFRDRRPRELSGGQQQRVGVARALAVRPALMLMDEPFGALDPINRDRLQSEYRRLHDELKLTTVLVTHDMTEALLLADRIVVMQAGRVIQQGTPADLLAHPADDYVRQLLETPRRQAEQLERLAGAK
ncbi:MAG: ATP-binding cassette domain-containing protein [Planctomycetes bacterium]|nr:ATP-binding cassette domain-containing protein [Planctomycetota bacterium]